MTGAMARPMTGAIVAMHGHLPGEGFSRSRAICRLASSASAAECRAGERETQQHQCARLGRRRRRCDGVEFHIQFELGERIVTIDIDCGVVGDHHGDLIGVGARFVRSFILSLESEIGDCYAATVIALPVFSKIHAANRFVFLIQ